jgi:hypothetical protein
MRPDRAWEGEDAKVAGIHHFAEMGYRVLAFVDNEPSNLVPHHADSDELGSEHGSIHLLHMGIVNSMQLYVV